MIPRARPNYGIRSLLRAFFLPRAAAENCESVRSFLSSLFADRHCILAPSGRAAQYILMKALPGNDALVPAYTCSAVVEAARLAGKNVVYVDGLTGGFNLGPSDVKDHLRRGHIFVATHQYGMSCDAAEMARLCDEAGCTMVEDIAAALGAETSGRLAGEFGLAAFGSFDTTKLVHAPMKGGFIVTRDLALATRCKEVLDSEFPIMPLTEKFRLLAMAALLVLVTRTWLYPIFHWLNFTIRGQHTAETGRIAASRTEHYKYCFADWQAAVVLPQLRNLTALLNRRRSLYANLRHKLSGLQAITLPPEDRNRRWACVRFPILVQGAKLKFYEQCLRSGVDTGFSFSSLATPKEYDGAWATANAVLNLPFFDNLSAKEVDSMVAALKRMDARDA